MFDTLENWIPMGDKHRIALHRQDLVEISPLDFMDDGDVGCFPIRMARGYNGLFAGDKNLLEELRQEFENSEAPDIDGRQNELIHYLEREHGMEVLPVSLRGHSQGDWMDVLLWYKPNPELGGGSGVAVARAVLLELARDLQCYFAGDVYQLVVEELITYTAPNGNTIERWETVEDVDPVWDNYFDGRPDTDDLLMRLEIDPADYGVTDESKLELVN